MDYHLSSKSGKVAGIVDQVYCIGGGFGGGDILKMTMYILTNK